MIIPEMVGGNGVRFTRLGTTVGEDAGGGRVAGGRVAGGRITVEVGSDNTGCPTGVGKTVVGSGGVGEWETSAVGDNALAW